MKRLVQAGLQRVLGFQRYLFLFARFKVRTLAWDAMERDLLHFLSMLPEDGVVLDLGANVGVTTVLMARARPRCRVHAFEPIPDNHRVLERMVGHYRLTNTSLHDLALGAQSEEATMVMPRFGAVRMHGLSHVVHETIEGFGEGDRYPVSVRALDDLELGSEPVVGIKLDVENFEQYVLRGGARLLSEHRPLIYAELWANDNRKWCVQFLTDLGYEVKVLDQDLVPFDATRYRGQNFFFVPAAGGVASQGPR